MRPEVGVPQGAPASFHAPPTIAERNQPLACCPRYD